MKLLDRFGGDSARFALTYLLIFSVSVLSLGFITYRAVEQSLVAQLRDRISAESLQLIGDFEDDGVEELRHDIHERLEANPVIRLRYSVQGPGGRVIFDPLGDRDLESGWHQFEAEDGRPVLARVDHLDGGYVLTVGADLEPLKNLRGATRRWVGAVLGLTIVLGIFGAWVLVRRFRRRLESFSETASRVGRGRLGERLHTPSGDSELDQLAATINDMLERIEMLVENATRVTSNIAHDLRTPLSRLRQMLERLSARGGATSPEIDQAIYQLDECLDTFSALLRIAEIESGARRRAFDAIDMGDMLERLVDVYTPAALDQGIELILRLETQQKLHGDERMLSQALANVIENAMVHANATCILIRFSKAENGVTLTVSDNGNGVPASERNRVFEPFYRLDRSRSSRGNGLGLSLLRAVAQLHDIALQLDDASPGLIVRMEFSGDRVTHHQATTDSGTPRAQS